MSQFYGILDAHSGRVTTRQGNKTNGLRVRACAWGIGVNVDAWHSSGVDRMDIELNGGSDGARDRVPLFILTDTDTINDIANKLRAAAITIEKHAASFHGWPTK
jgi:hypothetical protein